MEVGSVLDFGLKSSIKSGNVISVQNIPDGTIVCNIEKHYGDGGTIVKAAGGSAVIFSHGDDGVTLKLPSGRFTTLHPKNRAMIGTLAGGGVGERPFMSAGGKWRNYRSRGRKYPIVRGVAPGIVRPSARRRTAPARGAELYSLQRRAAGRQGGQHSGPQDRQGADQKAQLT